VGSFSCLFFSLNVENYVKTLLCVVVEAGINFLFLKKTGTVGRSCIISAAEELDEVSGWVVSWQMFLIGDPHCPSEHIMY
jgi:hypothetical protein